MSPRAEQSATARNLHRDTNTLDQRVAIATLKAQRSRGAFASLRNLVRPLRYRVVPDEGVWPEFPGRLGQIEYHEGAELAVYSDRPRVFARLWALPGVRRWQVGDQEVRGLFPPESLQAVAGVIGARKRRTLSPETVRQKGAGTAYRATSAA